MRKSIGEEIKKNIEDKRRNEVKGKRSVLSLEKGRVDL